MNCILLGTFVNYNFSKHQNVFTLLIKSFHDNLLIICYNLEMTILNIITATDNLLKKKSSAVLSVDDGVQKLMQDMLETMYEKRGVGLAAPQIGVLKRVITIDLKEDDDVERPVNFYPLLMANPEILDKSKEIAKAPEGCLSVPNQRIEVERAESIKVKFLDYNNKHVELSTSGWLARVIQHEVDHLDGRLIIDYVSSLKKGLIMRKLKKHTNIIL